MFVALIYVCFNTNCIKTASFDVLLHRSLQSEAEQAELHQKLSSLQKELTVFKQQYDSLLEQVGQQHGLIQQLSQSGGDARNTECEGTQAGGECRAKPDGYLCSNMYLCRIVFVEEAVQQIDAEPRLDTSTSNGLSLMVSVDENFLQSDKVSRYSKFCTLHSSVIC